MRELSAKLTEGREYCTTLSTYSHTPLKLRSISKLQILITLSFMVSNPFGAQQVFFCLVGCVMSAAVKFNDQSGFCTIEVYNEVADGFLPLKTHWVSS